jgi:L-cysteine S-thiosulfotransferase
MRALLAALLLPASVALAQADGRRSGFDFMSPATQAMQKDDTQNPAFLWLQQGRQAFDSGCARCHGMADMRGVAARYPAWDAATRKPVTLSGRINACQVQHVKAAPLAPESDALLSLEMVVAHASRGLPIAPPADVRLAAARSLGARLYTQRFGQLSLSCAQCHDEHAGGRLGGSAIPQAHPGAYPIYRLEWQGVGSLQRRLRACMSGVRAEPFAHDSDELTALELHLMQRAAGLPVETPGVRP